MTITVEMSAVQRIEELRKAQNKPGLMLRVRVEGGGCSGFQYILGLTDAPEKDDRVFAEAVLTDDISLPFLEGSTIRFENGLIGSEFKIDNPNATSGCGCGTSFSV
jgi:iron-sulfur cluster assembly accessory protein